MGQYYLIVNLDKRQYLHPHRFNEGLKLMEFGCSSEGSLTALTILLADGNGRGGGDLHSENPLVGTWAGDRIVITGDYADDGSHCPNPAVNLYAYATEHFEDISLKAIDAMTDDPYVRQRWAEMVKGSKWLQDNSPEVCKMILEKSAPKAQLAKEDS